MMKQRQSYLKEVNFDNFWHYDQLSEELVSAMEIATNTIVIRKHDKILKPYIVDNLCKKIRQKNNLCKVTRRFPSSIIIKQLYQQAKNGVATEIAAKKK